MPRIQAPLWWDEDNIASMDRHGVTTDDVEEVIFGSDGAEASYRIRRDGDYYKVFGETAAGRLLILVGEFIGNKRFRVFHAQDMRDRERRQYRRK